MMKRWCCTDNAFMPFSFASRTTTKGWRTFVGVPPSGGFVRPGFRLKAGLQPKATQQKPAAPMAPASQITTHFNMNTCMYTASCPAHLGSFEVDSQCDVTPATRFTMPRTQFPSAIQAMMYCPIDSGSRFSSPTRLRRVVGFGKNDLV